MMGCEFLKIGQEWSHDFYDLLYFRIDLGVDFNVLMLKLN